MPPLFGGLLNSEVSYEGPPVGKKLLGWILCLVFPSRKQRSWRR